MQTPRRSRATTSAGALLAIALWLWRISSHHYDAERIAEVDALLTQARALFSALCEASPLAPGSAAH